MVSVKVFNTALASFHASPDSLLLSSPLHDSPFEGQIAAIHLLVALSFSSGRSSCKRPAPGDADLQRKDSDPEPGGEVTKEGATNRPLLN